MTVFEPQLIAGHMLQIRHHGVCTMVRQILAVLVIIWHV